MNLEEGMKMRKKILVPFRQRPSHRQRAPRSPQRPSRLPWTRRHRGAQQILPSGWRKGCRTHTKERRRIVCCRIFRTRARRATRVAPRGHEPSAIRSRSQKLLARTAADSAIAAAAVELSRRLVPHMLPPCGCCRRAWRSAVLQGSADSILPRILLPPRLGTRM